MKASVHVMSALAVVVSLTGCSEQSSVQTLQERASVTLAPVDPCNRLASLAPLPNGVQVSFPSDALFLTGQTELSPCGRFVLASTIEAMLDPRIMQVVIEPDADISLSDAYLPRERAERVRRMLSDAGFVLEQPPVQVAPVAAQSPRIWRVVLAVTESKPAAQ